MNNLGQLLAQLPPVVTNVLQQIQSGNHAAVSNEDANAAFSHVTKQLSPEEFQQVAANAYQQLSPTRRSEVADYLRQQSQQQGGATPTATTLPTPSAAANDPAALADATAQIHAEGPNILQQLFARGRRVLEPDRQGSSPRHHRDGSPAARGAALAGESPGALAAGADHDPTSRSRLALSGSPCA